VASLLEPRLLNISDINREFRQIAAHNGWQEYHTPKNLAAAISVEAAELLAEFQWLSANESANLTPSQKQQVAGEVADLVMYLTELCVRLGIDMPEAVNAKIEFNKQRFASSTI
jgi:dCTP diphosphatase